MRSGAMPGGLPEKAVVLKKVWAGFCVIKSSVDSGTKSTWASDWRGFTGSCRIAVWCPASQHV
ncbi:MAG: hypothetical protein QOF94_695 [Acidobacteriaceae bacterium]|jgi:hypothetical protein